MIVRKVNFMRIKRMVKDKKIESIKNEKKIKAN